MLHRILKTTIEIVAFREDTNVFQHQQYTCPSGWNEGKGGGSACFLFLFLVCVCLVLNIQCDYVAAFMHSLMA